MQEIVVRLSETTVFSVTVYIFNFSAVACLAMLLYYRQRLWHISAMVKKSLWWYCSCFVSDKSVRDCNHLLRTLWKKRFFKMLPQYRKEDTLQSIGQNFRLQTSKKQPLDTGLRQYTLDDLRVA